MAAVTAHPLSAPDGALRGFRCEIRPARRCAYVQPVGELDLVTVPEVDAVLEQLSGDGFEELVLDLRGVAFMDSTGLHLVVRWCKACPGFGVVAGPASVQRVFALTRTDTMLRLVEQPEVAAAG